MNLSEFVENHCVGKQYDSCVDSPCAFASHSGCRHPLHPKHAAQHHAHLTPESLASSQAALQRIHKFTRIKRLPDHTLPPAGYWAIVGSRFPHQRHGISAV